MSKRIFKYVVPLTSNPEIEMPYHAKPLSMGFQGETLMLWALVDPDKYPTIKHRFRFLMTGENIEDPLSIGTFIGTVTKNDIVMHLFDIENL